MVKIKSIDIIVLEVQCFYVSSVSAGWGECHGHCSLSPAAGDDCQAHGLYNGHRHTPWQGRLFPPLDNTIQTSERKNKIWRETYILWIFYLSDICLHPQTKQSDRHFKLWCGVASLYSKRHRAWCLPRDWTYCDCITSNIVLFYPSPSCGPMLLEEQINHPIIDTNFYLTNPSTLFSSRNR